MSIAGLVGIVYSMAALRGETLQHLDQEVTSRSTALSRFVDQLASELLYLGSSSPLRELADGLRASPRLLGCELRRRLERDFAAFARLYPFVYQVRFLDDTGMEAVRVDRRGDRLYVVPEQELQDKSDRYYAGEALAKEPGEIYISPLDLNVERGQIEVPNRPVVRFAAAVTDSGGHRRGILIINLHAEFMLGQIQEMASIRGGVAYLFDCSGFYVARDADAPQNRQSHEMRSAEDLVQVYSRRLITRILSGARGNEMAGDWIVAYAPVATSASAVTGAPRDREWSIALAFPQRRIFAAVFNLYILYSVLAVSLLVTAVAGFILSRHLLRPLTLLREETGQIAQGNFSHRVEIRGSDEVADLGRSFNLMAQRLEALYQSLQERRERLEEEVAARTAALERERERMATVIENTADGILALDVTGRIELANKAAEGVFQARAGGLQGRRLAELWPEWDRFAERAVDAGAAGPRIEFDAGGRLLAMAVTRLSSGDNSRGFIAVVRDISEERRLINERRELDRQMFQMEKMTTMGELAMGLAHEIGNPLAGMKTVVQALLGEKELNEYVRKYLGRIQNEVDRLRGQDFDLVLLDLRLPDMSGMQVMRTVRETDDRTMVVVMTAYPEVRTAVSAVKAGAYDYLNKPFDLDDLKGLVARALETGRLRVEVERLRVRAPGLATIEGMVGASPAFTRVVEITRRIALASRTPVLIRGESGTGKERIAEAIHNLSPRAPGAWVTLNCSAISEGLLESEMFGHERGAFTDAKSSKRGLLELADGGTLFLDEIGDLSLALQPKLLRAIETQRFRRVGGQKELQVDVRFVAATNRDLAEMVKRGHFREDLYYRLNVATIDVPPLRERRPDVMPLAQHFLEQGAAVIGVHSPRLDPAVRELLEHYAWPGNVRELRNVIERALILCGGEPVTAVHLPREIAGPGEKMPAAGSPLEKDGHIKTTPGQFVAVAIVSEEIREGVAMANFNFPGAPANSVVHAVPDPMTHNYRYKLGRGVLTKMGESPYKHSFTSMSLKPRPII